MIRSNNKIIIIGTLPPPIGGVSIYNQRLYDFLQQEQGIDVDFIDYKRNNIATVTSAVLSHKIIYLNCSSSVFKLFVAVLAACTGKKFLVTFHGNIERNTGSIHLLDKIILKLATLSVVLNKRSFDFALRYTRHLFLGTSFIPPLRKEVLAPVIKDLVLRCRKEYKIICSSNAHNVSIDKAGNEIYQVQFLLRIFDQLPDCCIILSDPSGMYSSYLATNKVNIPRNVFIIKETHSYFELLKEIDVMLRITTTDGDSISVREALYLQKIVIASNVVDRPAGVIEVNISEQEIKEKLQQVANGDIRPSYDKGENAGEQVLKIFASL